MITNRKIWIDIEEPKTAIMLSSLIREFEKVGTNLLITARDFDSTFQILDSLNIKYKKIGKHGGPSLEDKLQAYINRITQLYQVIKKYKPDYFVTFSSVEGVRIAFGLKIPSIGYNDEPRNESVCKLILPFLEKTLIPKCVPINRYLQLGATKENLITYDGIDEVAWLWDYIPNKGILKEFNLIPKKYVIVRTEPTVASYLIDYLKPEESLISKFLPQIVKKNPDYNYLILVRNYQQLAYLKDKLRDFKKNVTITQFLPNMLDLCYYASLVISGGGTIVRESSLLNTPCIEFFPGETAPQEQFLIKNGFPLEHIKDITLIVSRALEILSNSSNSEISIQDFKDKLKSFENPNQICFDIVMKELK